MRLLGIAALLFLACAHAPDTRELEARLAALEARMVEIPLAAPSSFQFDDSRGIYLASLRRPNMQKSLLGQLPSSNCTGPSAACSAASFTTTGASTALKFVSTQASGSNAVEVPTGTKVCFDGSTCAVNLKYVNATSLQYSAGAAWDFGSTNISSGGTYTSSVGSGTNGLAVSTNGARIDFGAGASDYASSDGTTVTFAGPIASAGTITSTNGGGVVAPMVSAASAQLLDVMGFVVDGATNVGVRIGNRNALSTAGAAIAKFYSDFASTSRLAIQATGAVNPDFTDDSGTTGNRTVNKPAGINAFAAAGTTITITNSVVKATSLVYAQLQTADGTCTFIKSVVPAAGSFVATVNAGCTGTTKIGWIVFNGN